MQAVLQAVAHGLLGPDSLDPRANQIGLDSTSSWLTGDNLTAMPTPVVTHYDQHRAMAEAYDQCRRDVLWKPMPDDGKSCHLKVVVREILLPGKPPVCN